jgi:hypothetical protein
VTENQLTMQDVLKAFSDAAFINYKSHDYEAGYLQGMIIEMMRNLPQSHELDYLRNLVIEMLDFMPLQKQTELIESAIVAAQRQEQHAINGMS